MRTLLILVLLSGTAFAQAPGAAPTIDPLFSKEVDSPEGPPKNLLSAYLITVASTSVPVMLGALAAPDDGHQATTFQNAMGIVGIAGMVLGPSAGHWYAGEGVTTGLALRLTGAAVIGGLVVGDPHANHVGMLIVGGITGVGLWEAGVIWDLATLPRSVRRYNKQHQVQLAPMAITSGSGLSVAGTF
jgi:hypothetical protein